MPKNIHALYSESSDYRRAPNGKPLQLDELQSLILMAAECGYSIKDAHDMVPPYGVVSSELYAVWYSIEHAIPIFPDNIRHLIHLTGWTRSTPQDSGIHFDQEIGVPQAMSRG